MGLTSQYIDALKGSVISPMVELKSQSIEWVPATFMISEHRAIALWLNEIKAIDVKMQLHDGIFYVMAAIVSDEE